MKIFFVFCFITGKDLAKAANAPEVTDPDQVRIEVNTAKVAVDLRHL